MTDVFTFPHIPYWFPIRQAIGITKKSLLSDEKCLRPLVILVFDEKYNLLGTVSLTDILRGLEPKLMKPASEMEGSPSDAAGSSPFWDRLFGEECGALAEKPVGEVMVQARFFAEPDDPVTKAAYLMIHHDLLILPVLEYKKKLIGVVRIVEIFDEVSRAVLKK